jgi:Zn-dependent M28 family amino/carboxypeptidase
MRIPSLVFVATACLAVCAASKPAQLSIIDGRPLIADLKTLSSDDMQGRRTGTPGSEKARAFIVERFRASGVAPFGATYERSFPSSRGRGNSGETGINLIGHIDGKSQPRRYIAISAHYDHLGVRNGVVFNGADDNASGTAALFAIASYFTAHPPANSLLFAAFDAEELGLLGSQAFVKDPPVDHRRIAIDLNLDMIGREPNNKLFVVGTRLQPFLKPTIEGVAKSAPVRLLMGHEDPAQPEDWTRDSDHFSFLQAGIPALYFGVEDFDQHHKATDDFETMTTDFYIRAVETMIQVIERFDANLDDVEKTRTK